MKRITAIILMCTMVFTLCACKDKKEKETTTQKDVGTVNVINFVNDDIAIGIVENKIDIDAAFKNMKRVPQMLYGNLQNEQYPKDTADLTDGIDFVHSEKGEIVLAVLPRAIVAGSALLVKSEIALCDEYEIAELEYWSDKGAVEFFAAYDMVGDKVTFTVVESYSYNPISLNVDVKLSNYKFAYDFSLNGKKRVLSTGGKSVALVEYGDTTRMYSLSGYIDDNSPDMPEDMYVISCSTLESLSPVMIGLKSQAGTNMPVFKQEYENASARFYPNGLFVLARKDAVTEKVDTKEYYALRCGSDGFILFDGSKTYCYTKKYVDIAIAVLGANLDPLQIAELSKLEDYKLAELIKARDNIYNELETELGKLGVKATIDRVNGEVSLDSTVLFATNESTLSDEGKAFLKKFVAAYTNVILNNENKKFLSKIMIEGHTDSTGTDDVNIPLSKARADSVLEYCTSAESGLSAEQINSVKGLFGTLGCASGRPILNADGTENTDASRRVGFRFIVNINPETVETSK